ncbi:MAG TPA: response regulator transcription factor [Acetobacteraceae bacterium]|nr:response regulator transcription factor [Acetobacteraceae bacterium]
MPGRRPILVVDDDDDLRETMADQFEAEARFALTTAASLAEADAILKTENTRVDAVILDVRLPDGDGRDYCLDLRRRGHKMPVIMLTGSSDEEDVVRGLDAGANDYIAKPFRVNELLARLRAQLRIYDETPDAALEIGPYIFRPAARMLHDKSGDRRSKLTDKEVAILKHLYRAEAKVVDRDMLLREVWGYATGVTTHTLETHIYRLRQKMELDPTKPAMLLTVYRGYRLDPTMGQGDDDPTDY